MGGRGLWWGLGRSGGGWGVRFTGLWRILSGWVRGIGLNSYSSEVILFIFFVRVVIL